MCVSVTSSKELVGKSNYLYSSEGNHPLIENSSGVFYVHNSSNTIDKLIPISNQSCYTVKLRQGTVIGTASLVNKINSFTFM